GAVTRIQRVHAVEHTQERRLAAAGGTDEGGDPSVGQREIDVLERLHAAVVEIEMPHRELDRRAGPRRRGPRAEPDFGCAHQCLPPELSENSTRRALM